MLIRSALILLYLRALQSRRIGVGLAVVPGPGPAVEEPKEGRAEQKRSGAQQLSGQASHIHGAVYGGHGECSRAVRGCGAGR